MVVERSEAAAFVGGRYPGGLALLVALLCAGVAWGGPEDSRVALFEARAEAVIASSELRALGQELVESGRPDERVKAAFRDFVGRARASGYDLDLKVLDADTLLPADYDRFTWTDLVTPYLGKTLRLSRQYADAPWLENDLVYYELRWSEREPARERPTLEMQAAAAGLSVLEMLPHVLARGEELPVAITAYRVRARLGGDERTYRGIALWRPAEEGGFDFKLFDNVAPDVREQEDEGVRIVDAEEWERLYGAPVSSPMGDEPRGEEAVDERVPSPEPAVRAAGLDVGRLERRLRAAFQELTEGVARTGQVLIVEPLEVETLFPAQYGSHRLADLVDVAGQDRLQIVRHPGDGPESRGRGGHFAVSWVEADGSTDAGAPGQERAAEGRTLEDLAAARRAEGGEAAYPVAVTAYRHLLGSEGREVVYHGIALWHRGADGELGFDLRDPYLEEHFRRESEDP